MANEPGTFAAGAEPSASDRLAQLQELTAALSAAATIGQVGHVITVQARAALGARTAALWVIEGDALALVAHTGNSAAYLEPFRRIPLDSSIPAASLLVTRQPRWVQSEAEFFAASPLVAARAKAAGQIKAYAALPLVVEERVIGVIVWGYGPQHAFVADEKAFIRTVVGHSAQAIDRARLLENSRSAQQTLQAVVDGSPAAIVLVDRDATVRMWNSAAESMYGWAADEVLGRRYPASGPRLDEVMGNIDRVIRGEPFLGVESQRVRKDGSPVDIAAWAAPVRRADGTVQCLSIAIDNSARRRAEDALRAAENHLRLALDAASIGTWESDLSSSVAQWDARCKELHGLPVDGDVTLERVLAAIHPEDRPHVREVMHKARDPEGSGTFEYTYRTIGEHDAALRWVTARGSYFFEGDVAIRARGVCVDVTAAKRAEGERSQLLAREQAARAEAERANHAKDEFLAMLSHELRTPLNAITGWVSMLRGDAIAAERRAHAIEVIERNARAQEQLIADLLDMSRVSSGRLRLDVAPLEPVSVVTMAIDAVRPVATAKSVRIVTEFDEPIDAISGDAHRLQQVVWNLATNAVKFSKAGGEVRVSLAREGAAIVLHVRDQGEGMTAEFLLHIFEPFRQADRGFARKAGGLGLGLAISRHLVEMHGGSIQALSEGPGKGAEFIVRLPITGLNADSSPRVAALKNAQSPQASTHTSESPSMPTRSCVP